MVIVIPLTLLILLSPTNLLGVVHNLPSLFVAIFLIYAKKANFVLDTFLHEFQNVRQHQKAAVSISVMVAFMARVFFLGKSDGDDIPDLQPFLLQTASALITLGLFDLLK